MMDKYYVILSVETLKPKVTRYVYTFFLQFTSITGDCYLLYKANVKPHL